MEKFCKYCNTSFDLPVDVKGTNHWGLAKNNKAALSFVGEKTGKEEKYSLVCKKQRADTEQKRRESVGYKKWIRIHQIDFKGNIIRTLNRAKDFEQFGFNLKNVSNCCQYICNSHKDHYFKYENDSNLENFINKLKNNISISNSFCKYCNKDIPFPSSTVQEHWHWRWMNDPRYKGGGIWRCKIKDRDKLAEIRKKLRDKDEKEIEKNDIILIKPDIKTEFKIGEIFGNWTIINTNLYDTTRDKRVLCKCICGKERLVKTYYLRSGKSTGCGCLHKSKRFSIDRTQNIGKKIGNLTITKYLGKKAKNKDSMFSSGRHYYEAVCECGSTTIISHDQFLDKSKTECNNCSDKYRKEAESHIGEKFGRLVITGCKKVKINNGKFNYVYSSICECGNTLPNLVVYASFVSGHTKSCGCLSIETASINATYRALNNFKSDVPWYFYNKGIKVSCKSSYEAIFGAYLDYKNINFKYEPKTFILENGKSRYTPDFYLEDEDCYIELKGYETNKDQERKRGIVSKMVTLKLFKIEDIYSYITYPIKTIDTYKIRAKKLGIPVEDYFAFIFIRKYYD